jgi:hypothetical protein
MYDISTCIKIWSSDVKITTEGRGKNIPNNKRIHVKKNIISGIIIKYWIIKFKQIDNKREDKNDFIIIKNEKKE